MPAEIIYTRKVSDDFFHRWKSKGLILRSVPMIDIRQNQVSAPAKDLPNRLIFTSQHAVHAFLQQLSFEEFHEVEVACIEHKTRQLLEASGIIPSIYAPNAEELLEKICKNWRPGPILYLCGSIRRDVLPDGLTQAGFAYQELQVYQTELLAPTVSWGNAQDIVFFSPSGVRAFFQQNILPESKHVWAIGKTTARALEDEGVNEVRIAANPVSEQLLEEILLHHNSPITF